MKPADRARLVATAVLSAAGVCSASGAPTGPIRIGFLTPLSGAVRAERPRHPERLPAATSRKSATGPAGARIELIVEDDEAIPAVGLTKARKLVERDRVHLMAGALLSSTGYALAPYIDSMKIPMVYPVVSADDLTQRRRSRWIVRTGWSGSQPNHAFGEYAYHTLKLRRVATIALDYAFGWESVGGFQRTFEAEGGTIVQKIWCRCRSTTSRPTSPRFPATSTPCTRCFSGARRCSSCGNTRNTASRGACR